MRLFKRTMNPDYFNIETRRELSVSSAANWEEFEMGKIKTKWIVQITDNEMNLLVSALEYYEENSRDAEKKESELELLTHKLTNATQSM